MASIAFRKSRWKSLMAAVARDLRDVVYFISNKGQERGLGCRDRFRDDIDLTDGVCAKMVFL